MDEKICGEIMKENIPEPKGDNTCDNCGNKRKPMISIEYQCVLIVKDDIYGFCCQDCKEEFKRMWIY